MTFFVLGSLLTLQSPSPAPMVRALPPQPALYERMGLRVISVGKRVAVVGGFSYPERVCLRPIGLLGLDGREKLAKISLAVGRNHFEVVALDRERFLAIGGYSEDYDTLAEVECVDLGRNKVEAWPWLPHPVELFSCVALPGKVAVIGGLTAQGQTKTWDSIQLIDLRTHETSLNPKPLVTSRFGGDAVWLPLAGKVLIAGGKHLERVDGKAVYTAVRSLEWWNPSTGEVSPAGEMTVARDRPKIVVLPDGKVLIAGGKSDTDLVKTIELYDPATQTSHVVAEMGIGRMAVSVLPYSDQGVFLAGGWVDNSEAGAAIEYLSFGDWKVTTVAKAKVSRAENAMLWLTKDTFALVGGKDAFQGRNPHSYHFQETELFRVTQSRS